MTMAVKDGEKGILREWVRQRKHDRERILVFRTGSEQLPPRARLEPDGKIDGGVFGLSSYANQTSFGGAEVLHGDWGGCFGG